MTGVSDPNESASVGLPITDCLDELTSALCSKAVVLRAPPGAVRQPGSPRTPITSVANDGKILLIQPAASQPVRPRRLADSMNCTVGDLVGYHVRFDNGTAKTRV